MSGSPRQHWSFGDFVYDEAARELSLAGEPVVLERKPLDVLAELLRNAGEVVTKQELAEAVWTRPIISDEVIGKAVGKLRAALGPAGPERVKTVHGVGYRFVGELTVETSDALEPLPRIALSAGDSPPTRPQWKLERSLGVGGYGDVWLARHEKTGEARVFKFAADGAALTGLKREVTLYRVLIAAYENPTDFVRLLDWNLEQAPYFVEAEHVAGGSLLEWTEQQGGAAAVPASQRLELMAQVAEAVGRAHDAGVLHKDLKPANVVIEPGETPRARLSDFGSGRVLDEARLREAGITRLGFTRTVTTDISSSGTPMYLAPEVLSGQPLTARADLYALGVMLYQAAIGDFGRPLAPGWERDIADELLRRDIAEAVDGSPGERLGDAGELARRIRELPARSERRAQQRAAAERERRLAERLQAVRRRRGWVAALAGVLALGLIAALSLAARLQSALEAEAVARDQAERQVRIAAAINEFLTDDLLALANPEDTGRNDLGAIEMLDRAVGSIGERFVDDPGVEASVREAIARAYRGVGRYGDAVAQLQAARTVAGGPAERVRLAVHEAEIRFEDLGEAETARALLAESRQAIPDTALPERLRVERDRLAALMIDDAEASAAALADVAARAERALPVGDEQVLRVRATLGARLSERRDPAAIPILEAVVADYTGLRGSLHRRTVESRLNLAEIHLYLRDNERALSIAEPLLPDLVTLYGEGHALTLFARNTRARSLQQLGRLDEAVAQYRITVEQQERHFGADNDGTPVYWTNFAHALAEAGHGAEALAYYRKVHDWRMQRLGPAHRRTLYSASQVAAALSDNNGQHEEALAFLAEPLALAERELGGDHPTWADLAYAQAMALAALQRIDEALPIGERAAAILHAAYGPEDRAYRQLSERIADWRGR